MDNKKLTNSVNAIHVYPFRITPYTTFFPAPAHRQCGEFFFYHLSIFCISSFEPAKPFCIIFCSLSVFTCTAIVRPNSSKNYHRDNPLPRPAPASEGNSFSVLFQSSAFLLLSMQKPFRIIICFLSVFACTTVVRPGSLNKIITVINRSLYRHISAVCARE